MQAAAAALGRERKIASSTMKPVELEVTPGGGEPSEGRKTKKVTISMRMVRVCRLVVDEAGIVAIADDDTGAVVICWADVETILLTPLVVPAMNEVASVVLAFPVEKTVPEALAEVAMEADPLTDVMADAFADVATDACTDVPAFADVTALLTALALILAAFTEVAAKLLPALVFVFPAFTDVAATLLAALALVLAVFVPFVRLITHEVAASLPSSLHTTG